MWYNNTVNIKMLYLCKCVRYNCFDMNTNFENKTNKLKSTAAAALFIAAALLSVITQCLPIPILVLASMFLSIAIVAFLSISLSSFLPMLAVVPAAIISYFLYDSSISALNILIIPVTAAAVTFAYRYKVKRALIDICTALSFFVVLLSLTALAVYVSYGKLDLDTLTGIYNTCRSDVIATMTELYTNPDTGEVLISAEDVVNVFDYAILLSPSAVICTFAIIGHAVVAMVNTIMRLFSVDSEYLTPAMVRLRPSKVAAVLYLFSYLFVLIFGSFVSEHIYISLLNLSIVLTPAFALVGFSLAKSYFVLRRKVKGIGIGTILLIILLLCNLPILIYCLSFVGSVFVLIGDRIKLVRLPGTSSEDGTNNDDSTNKDDTNK